ncbi:MAG: hypothetical protein WCH21_01455 [Bacteroidota bacterium]
MKTSFSPPPHFILSAHKGFKLFIVAIIMFSTSIIIRAQIVTTFSATNVNVTDTLTSGVMIDAAGITASDTIKAADDVLISQNLHVAGDAKIQGNVSTQNAFIFNSANNLPDLGIKVFNSTNPINTGRIIQIGDPLTFPTVPVPCSLPNGQPWLVMNGGIITKATNGLVNSSLSMYTAPWNGSGYIESEGTDNLGGQNTALLLNYFCGRDIFLCTNTGLSNGGGKVRVGNFLSAAQHVEIGDPQWGIASNNSPANNVALDMHVNNGKAIKVKT